jgi:hypothetical protein
VPTVDNRSRLGAGGATKETMKQEISERVEIYTPVRKAEFLLGNATSSEEYAEAVAELRRMGLDPEQIEHFRPAHLDRRRRTR